MTKQFPALKRAKVQTLPVLATPDHALETGAAQKRAPSKKYKENNQVSSVDTKKMPQISIVLPVYNGAQFLEQALDSILTQDFADFELICVDDCSTDATPEILLKYAARDPRITALRNETNLKLPASLNRGFKQARGDWFTWTSDDNILDPKMLSRLMEIAQNNSGYDIFHADFILIDGNGNHGNRITVDPADELIFGNDIGACFLYRRDVDIAIGGYDENLFGVEDYDFWLRASRQFRFYQVHECLYYYRRHDASLTSARAQNIHAMAATIMEREIRRLPASKMRALAWINLMCRDPYRMRIGMAFRALADDPGTTLASIPRMLRWFLYMVKQNIFKKAA